MTRTTTIGTVLAAAGMFLGGCTASQWQELGDRLIDGVTLDVGMGLDGQPTVGLGYSSQLASEQSVRRQMTQIKQRLVASAMGSEMAPVGDAAMGDDAQLREMVREMVVAELFPERHDGSDTGN